MDRIAATAILKSKVVLDEDIEMIFLKDKNGNQVIISVDNPTGKISIQGNGFYLAEINTNNYTPEHNVVIKLESKSPQRPLKRDNP